MSESVTFSHFNRIKKVGGIEMEQIKLTNYLDIYKILKKELRWKVTDNKIILTIANFYAMNDKPFHLERFFKIADEIKSQASLFSSMRSYSRFTTAAMLDINFDDPLKKVPELYHYYSKLREHKFPSGVYTYLAASILLTNEERIQPSRVIPRAKEIYDEMKKEHIFLTGHEDYPLALLIACEEKHGMVEKIEQLYEDLNNNGLSKGNNLQFLSHILALNSDETPQKLVERSTYISDTLRQHQIRPKATYYPIIGLLAYLPNEQFDMETILKVYQSLNEEIRWQKEMNFITAVSLYVHDKIEKTGVTETSISTTLEAILQAQQAVIISTVAASAAASSNNSGGN